MNFFDNIYGTLFQPDETFDELKEKQFIEQAFIIVVAVSALFPLLFSPAKGDLSGLFFNTLLAVLAGVISWVVFASFFEIVANIFNQGGKIRSFLTLSAFSLLPWLLLAPIELFKTAGIFGEFIGILSGLIIWLWTTTLVIIAVIKTYNLDLGRALLFVIIPFIGGVISFNWFIGFFTTLTQVLST